MPGRFFDGVNQAMQRWVNTLKVGLFSSRTLNKVAPITSSLPRRQGYTCGGFTVGSAGLKSTNQPRVLQFLVEFGAKVVRTAWHGVIEYIPSGSAPI
jgi:hypothetical protein